MIVLYYKDILPALYLLMGILHGIPITIQQYG